ncbi:competence protein CoiA family protein [Kitasatospora sp. NPDC058190]|uniref:competence protein CoiA family protein n=1 Tax=Kitasatospora sp. NPDC058190 TaxID=3346371 RepID=UPI0036DADC29
MAFTAVHALRGRLDASRDDLGCGWSWAAVHRARPRVPLACPDCGHSVHAKLSPRRRMRFFAHDPGAPRCALARESMDHHLIKLDLATEVRAAGWFAELEARAADGTWRADVMAVSPIGSRMAWEAQLSAITPDGIRERTERFARHGVPVCWVTTGPRPWLGMVPSIRVAPPGEVPDGAAGAWDVAAGLAWFRAEPPGRGGWEGVSAPLGDFVSAVLAGRTVPVRTPAYGPYRLRADQRLWDTHWSTPAHAAAALEYERTERERTARAEQAERERQAASARREEAWRQERARRIRLAAPATVDGWRSKIPMARRWKLEDAAARWVTTRTGTAPFMDHGAFADPGGQADCRSTSPMCRARYCAPIPGLRTGPLWPGWWSSPPMRRNAS